MNKNLRKTVIAGNWKMNKTPSEALEFVKELAPIADNADCDVVACVPYVCLQNALASAEKILDILDAEPEGNFGKFKSQ